MKLEKCNQYRARKKKFSPEIMKTNCLNFSTNRNHFLILCDNFQLRKWFAERDIDERQRALIQK